MKNFTIICFFILLSGPLFAARSNNFWGSAKSVNKVASDGYAMRDLRKVGVGFGVSGQHGLMGVQLELNFFPETSVVTGFGIGDNFQTFNLQIKRIMGGKSFMPYATAGYSRWYTTTKTNSFKSSNPDFLADKFLNNNERNGQFAENIIYPGFGFQYMQLAGNWAGTSIYAEILLLIDVDDLVSVPTGSLGYLYYF